MILSRKNIRESDYKLTLNQFFALNDYIVIFMYGLVFFLMGFGILLKNRQHSRFNLAKHLHWLALFGIVHALADWGHLFIPIHKEYASQEFYVALRMVRIIINSLSFAFLFQFGLSLLSIKKKLYILKYFPLFLFILWFIQLVLYKSFLYIEGDELWWVRVGDIWSRYILAFPGGILSGVGIYMQRKEFFIFNQNKFIRILYLASISLILYGVFGGIIVPEGPLLFASYLNTETFFLLTGVPIEVFRGILGIIIALSVLKIIQVFDQEYIMRLQESEKEKAIIDERNRFAQDLHDGIIQSIYATNLQLEVVKHLIRSNPSEAEQKLSSSLSKRNQIIGDIRQYIGELRRATNVELSLKERIEEVVDEMGIRERLKVRIEYAYSEEVSVTVIYHLTFIIKEAISNVMKHAHATELMICVAGNSSQLTVEMTDDGVGFSKDDNNSNLNNREKQGIINMKARTENLGGMIDIISNRNKGTMINIIIPNNGGSHDKNLNSRRS